MESNSLLKTQAVDKDQRLLTIFQVAYILATEYDLDIMLEKFLICLIETLEAADAGLLLVRKPGKDRLVVRAIQGYDSDSLKNIELALGESMSGQVLQRGQAEIYTTPQVIAQARANLSPANREFVESITIDGRPLQSVICIPLLIRQIKVGVLRLDNLREPESFDQADLPFLKAVADLIALSIENAHLKKEIQDTRALKETNRLKSELISMLAHEMRTPLASIKGYSTALLMEEVTFGAETQVEFLHTIDQECDVLQDLIHDLLESSIIDAGLLRIELQPVRLPILAKKAVAETMRQTDKHRLVLDFLEGFPIVDADPDRIVQVLRNLLDNAIKYSPQGGLIVVRGKVSEDEVILSVADQGIGLAPEHVNRLFEKFFRVDSGLGQHVVGSGLGLPICHTIVESHGGRIWAESELGQGTTLYFTIPLVQISQMEGVTR